MCLFIYFFIKYGKNCIMVQSYFDFIMFNIMINMACVDRIGHT